MDRTLSSEEDEYDGTPNKIGCCHKSRVSVNEWLSEGVVAVGVLGSLAGVNAEAWSRDVKPATMFRLNPFAKPFASPLFADTKGCKEEKEVI